MQRDVGSGTILIAGSLASVLVMSLHPTSHDLLDPQRSQGQAHLNVLVHSLALAATPALFMGLLGLWCRLGAPGLATAAIVAFGFGGVAILSAAVASGFVATEVFARLREGEGHSRELYHVLAAYTGMLNQGYAKVSVVAWSVAILLFSVAILRSRQMSRAAGIGGIIVGAGVLLVFLSGHVRLNVHGYGMVVFAQSAWLVWIGILLCRHGGDGGAERREP